MKPAILIVVFLFSGTSASAQDSVANGLDTLRRGWAPESWGRFVPGLRVAGGFQRSWFLEAGISMQKMSFASAHGFFHRGYYLSGTWVPPAYREKGVLGVGIGGEMGSNGSTGCVDLRYYSDGVREDFMLTPKYMFGLAIVDIGYGYNISFNKRPFPQIGRHQVALRINTNAYFHDRQLKARKRRAEQVGS